MSSQETEANQKLFINHLVATNSVFRLASSEHKHILWLYKTDQKCQRCSNWNPWKHKTKDTYWQK